MHSLTLISLARVKVAKPVPCCPRISDLIDARYAARDVAAGSHRTEKPLLPQIRRPAAPRASAPPNPRGHYRCPRRRRRTRATRSLVLADSTRKRCLRFGRNVRVQDLSSADFENLLELS
jgi:hypothetical protein